MHINVEHHEDHAILHLRGEFDTYYVRSLQEEVDALIKAGTLRLVLNLRLVKFINSTALGAIIKVSKTLNGLGGQLALSRPSSFCRSVIEKVGLDRVVPIFDSDADAAAALTSGDAQAGKAGAHAGAKGSPEEDETSVLFAPTDGKRIEHFLSGASRAKGKVNPVHGHKFGANWVGVGRMASLDATGLRFTWAGGDTGLEPFAMGQLLAIGTELKVKFRMPMFQKGYCEALATVSEIDERDADVKCGVTFSEIADETRDAVAQYAKDLAFLKEELKKETDR